MDQTVQHVPAGDLRPGHHITDPGSIPGEVGEVVHVEPYRDGHGCRRVAVTVSPVQRGADPALIRHATETPVRLASAERVAAALEQQHRRQVAARLVALADHIEGGRLPLPGYVGLHVAVRSRPDLGQWASALDAEVRVSGGRPAVHVYGDGLSVHVRGPREETAAGDAGPSAAAGSEVTDSGPATTTAAGDGVAPADAPGETATSPVAGAGAAPGTPTGGSGVPGVTPDEPAGGAR